MKFLLRNSRAAGRRSGSDHDKAAGQTAPARWPRRLGRSLGGSLLLPDGPLRLMAAALGPRSTQLEKESEQAGQEGPTPSRLGLAQQQPPAEQAPASGGAPPLSPAARGGPEQEPEPEQQVPKTLTQLLSTFFSHPSTIIIACGLGALIHFRAQQPLHAAADSAVAVAVAAGWCLQEWVVHAALLHSKFDWAGRRIHEAHHQRPFFHVSIDDPPLVLAFMSASLGLFWLLFRGSELALTAAIAYYSMGLLYEFTHYAVHTRYVPRSPLARRIRQHHMLHHTRNEAFWLAFTVPAVDALFGTLPHPGSVGMSDMARRALRGSGRRRGGGAACGGDA